MAEPFIGEIRLFSWGIVPKGWAQCNGQLLQVRENQALFTILGNKYGGDGATTFALPNLQGRVPMHPDGSLVAFAQAGGEAFHTLTVAEMPNHTHQATGGSDGTLTNPDGQTWGTVTGRSQYGPVPDGVMSGNALQTAGGGQGHENRQPYLTFNYCIATIGIYPMKS